MIADEDLAALRRLVGRPDLPVPVPLGAGTDHVAYAVDGDLVLRRPRLDGPGGAAAVEREIRVLDAVGRVSPVPVPTVVAAAPEAGLLLLRRLPGTSLLESPCPDPWRLVDQLTAFLDAVYALPTDLAPVDADPLGDHLAEAAATMPVIAPVLSPAQHRLVADFLAGTPPPEPPAGRFCHADLGAEHLLADGTGTRLTGVIDWSDAATTDPARDLGRLYRDLGPGPTGAVVDGLTGPTDAHLPHRVVFHARCALVEDLAFGLADGPRRYADAALAALTRTFSDPD
ncbi:phosphotransferase family protein [Micromonospora sp. SH-82]|uniref:phosphotransferase family protein n=1 Tax=Micromonospora sp. SH-82 TaxID=3132938 RepID=UPI003EC0312A